MSRPLRQILPKAGATPQPPGQVESSRNRRGNVVLACQQCRSRKIKCDGQRPSCSACRSKSFECEYKDGGDATSYAELKHKFQILEQQHLELIELYDMLRTRPEAEAYVILQRLRSSDDVRSTITLINEGDLLLRPPLPSTSPATNVSPQPSFTTGALLTAHHPKAYPPPPLPNEEMVGLGPQRTSILEMDPEKDDLLRNEEIRNAKSLDKPHPPCDSRLLRVRASQWTTVTQNDSILANLISLYLSWDHATLRLFDEDYFLDQISAGRTEHCSPLFVNAMLAAAALNYSAIDRDRSRTMGDAFFEEARRLWVVEEKETQFLKVPAAIFMSMWCNWNDKKEMGGFYISQASRIALDLGLFAQLDWTTQSTDPISRKHQKAMAVIAWGFFNFQTINKFFGLSDVELVGPPSFRIPYDAFSHEDDRDLWDPFPLVRPKHLLCRGQAFRAFSELFEILNAFLTGQGSTGATLAFDKAMILYRNMLAWADNMPPELVYGPQSLPMILDLHMFYHGIVIKVFRPFAGNSSPYRESAKTVMQASLAQLKRLLYIQRHKFDGPPFNATTIGSVHILTSSLLEALALSEEVDRMTSFDLVLAVQAMKKYGEVFPAIHKMLHGLLDSASRRHAELPRELKLILEELSARFFGPSQTKSSRENEKAQLPIDLQVAMTDLSGKDIEELVEVTYGLKLD